MWSSAIHAGPKPMPAQSPCQPEASARDLRPWLVAATSRLLTQEVSLQYSRRRPMIHPAVTASLAERLQDLGGISADRVRRKCWRIDVHTRRGTRIPARAAERSPSTAYCVFELSPSPVG